MSRASIVIPVHNRAALTRSCLEALAVQPMGVDAEIIVVDDASTDETPRLLAGRAANGALPMTIVTHPANAGFAASCNDGARAATGGYLVFLNNDTIPTPGWLDALVRHAEEHPPAAAVGAKLLFPDGTVQHAGLVIGEDRNPHHVYAGFPGGHPAVSRSRAFQAVTAACMLVRRGPFHELGGFDTGYRNGHEDVDLCLRLGEAGYEVRYCHEGVLYHLESATRGRGSHEAATNGRRYRQRWAQVVQPDDLRIYLDDGLVSVAYGETYPVRLQVSPLLASVHDGERREATELALRTRSQQVADLLHQVVALTVERAGGRPGVSVPPAADPEDDDELAEALSHLQRVLASRQGAAPPAATSALAYRRLVGRVREAVAALTPGGATVAVVSRGDDDLVDLEGRTGWHFPQGEDGTWAGHHPADSDDAVAAVEALCRRGATHFVVPAPSRWWLDQYRGFAEHLRTAHAEVAATDDLVVFALAHARQEAAS